MSQNKQKNDNQSIPFQLQSPGNTVNVESFHLQKGMIISHLHGFIFQLGKEPIHNLILGDRQQIMQAYLLHALDPFRLNQSA